MFSKSYIPNTVTALNALFGFFSIITAFQGDFYHAAIYIYVAAIFDLADGIVARVLKTSSEFGVQLDSLADVISFGAAPSVLIYVSYLHKYGITGLLLSSLVMLFGAFRLARFNVQLKSIDKKPDFSGLPIPLSAVTIATLIISLTEGNHVNIPYNYFVIPLVIVLSVLMVSKIKYSAFRINKDLLKDKPIYLGLIIVALILLFVTDGQALFFILLAIVLFGPARAIYMFFFHKDSEEIKQTGIN